MEKETINLNKLRCSIFSNKKDYTSIIEDKVFELGAVGYTSFYEENEFVNSLNDICTDFIILFFSSLDRASLKLIEYIQEHYSNIQLLVLTNDKITIENDFQSLTFKSFLRIECLREDSQYIPVSVEASLNFSISPCDLYVHISEEKYVKLFNKGEGLSLKDLKKYQDLSKDYLFINRSDGDIFYESIVKVIAKNVNAGLTVEELSYVSLIIEKLVPYSIALKIPQDMVSEVADCHVDVFREINTIAKDKAKYEGLDETPTRLAHITLSSLISSLVIDKIEWGSRPIQKKVIKCGLFCDVSLTEVDSKFVNKSTLSGQEYKTHPIKSSKILESISFIDNDIISMVEQHHEQGDGSGFPKGLSSLQITRMSCIFILSEFITKRLLSRKEWSVELLVTILDQIPLENRKDNFEESFNILQNIFKHDC